MQTYSVRAGIVSSIDYNKGLVRVTLTDQDDAVTPPLPMLSHEYNMPAIRQPVLCLFLGTGTEFGFCLGPFYNDDNLPASSGVDIYEKVVLDEYVTKYDRSTKTLTIDADNIVFNGNLRVNGNLSVDGEIKASGDITPNVPV